MDLNAHADYVRLSATFKPTKSSRGSFTDWSARRRSTFGRRRRKIGNAQDLLAPAAVRGGLLPARLYRPDQREFCGADHARRSQANSRRVWLCGRYILLGLFPLRGAEQRRPEI